MVSLYNHLKKSKQRYINRFSLRPEKHEASASARFDEFREKWYSPGNPGRLWSFEKLFRVIVAHGSRAAANSYFKS